MEGSVSKADGFTQSPRASGRLDGKVCPLLGGGGSSREGRASNGQEVATTFAREYAKVFVVDRDAQAAPDTVRQIKDGGGDAAAFQADASQHANVKAAVAVAAAWHGRINVLHNNVGIEVRGGVVATSESDWDTVHAVNLKSIADFCDAFAERGLKPEPKLIRAEQSSMEFAFSEALALLSAPVRPTAFVCLGTRILAGVLQGLRHSGLSVPDDVSVVGVGDTDLSQLFSPAITSLTWDLEAVGTATAELMLARLSTAPGREAVEPERIVMTTQMILRDSCGPLSGASTAPPEPARAAVKPSIRAKGGVAK